MDNINWPETGLFGSILIVALSFFYLVLKSYMEQKGKNYADKGDIANITHEVEEVKTQYASTLALLNTNLSLASKGIETFESEALKRHISFHEACSFILNDVSNIDIGTIQYKEQLNDYINQTTDLIKDSTRRLTTAKANLDLFNDNYVIEKKAAELFVACKTYNGKLYTNLTRIAFEQAVTKFDAEQLQEVKEKGNSQEIEYNQKMYNANYQDLKLAKKLAIEYVNGDDHREAVELIKEYESILKAILKEEKLKLLNS